MTSDKQTKSQPLQQNNDSDRGRTNLSESDIAELISFFQLLAKWDRGYMLKAVPEVKEP